MSLVDVLAIFGPTGVGKTSVALALAERLREEDPVLISADALQLYRGIETLTGAADAAGRVELVSVLGVTGSCSAGQYARMAHERVDAALAAGRRPIVVGGTGLYLRAALTELDLRPPVPAAVRERWLAAVAQRGPEAVHAELERRDPIAAARVAPTDRQRIVRAHELLDVGAEPPAGEQLWTSDTRHPTLLVGLVMEREALATRIDERVDAMVAAGARDEVLRADAAGASPAARQALGFDELLRGDVQAMKTRTRRYAKRQLTWMRKLPGVELHDVTARTPEDVVAAIVTRLRETSR